MLIFKEHTEITIYVYCNDIYIGQLWQDRDSSWKPSIDRATILSADNFRQIADKLDALSKL